MEVPVEIVRVVEGDRRYLPGEIVDAAKWTTLRALLDQGRVRRVVTAAPQETKTVDRRGRRGRRSNSEVNA